MLTLLKKAINKRLTAETFGFAEGIHGSDWKWKRVGVKMHGLLSIL